MSKTVAGFVLLAGLVMVVVGGQTAAWAAGAGGGPKDDLFYGVMNMGGIGVAVAGLASFFYGAMVFARKR